MRPLLASLALLVCACAPSERPVRVVGSSTVYPFAVMAAERVDGRVVIEQTGSGGGHKIFCAADSRADIVLSSRARLPREAADCDATGRSEVVELRLGSDAIVLLRAARQPDGLQALTRTQLWRAVAAELPGPDCELRPNTARVWSDVDAGLPATPIVVHGPPPTSGTRDAFLSLAVEAGARKNACMRALEQADPPAFRRLAGTLREDGAWVDAGEDDSALVPVLTGRPGLVGVVGSGVMRRTPDRLVALSVDGVPPDPAALQSGRYPLLRPLFLYADADMNPATRAMVDAMTSEAAIGAGGYLRRAGLIAQDPR